MIECICHFTTVIALGVTRSICIPNCTYLEYRNESIVRLLYMYPTTAWENSDGETARRATLTLSQALTINQHEYYAPM